MFTYLMEVKSVITAPSPGLALPGPGLYEISGLAWSGAGKIAKVEVSAMVATRGVRRSGRSRCCPGR